MNCNLNRPIRVEGYLNKPIRENIETNLSEQRDFGLFPGIRIPEFPRKFGPFISTSFPHSSAPLRKESANLAIQLNEFDWRLAVLSRFEFTFLYVLYIDKAVLGSALL